MLVRKLRPEDGLEYDKTQAIAFRYPLDLEARRAELLKEPSAKCERGWGAFTEAGEMAACLQIHDFQCNFDGHTVGLSGVGGVATRPEHRRGGAVRALFREWMREKRGSGALFSGLYPFSHEFYRKFGYETAFLSRGYRLRPDDLAPYRPAYDGEARMWTGDAPDGEIKALANAFGARYNMAIRRGEEAWSRWFSGDDFKEIRFRYKIYGPDGLCAYCVLRVEHEDGKEITKVRDCAWSDETGFRRLMGFLALAASDTLLQIALPEDAPLMLLAPEPYRITPRADSTPMARVLNAERVLALMRHPDGAEYTVGVRDEFLPENEGVYAVRARGGETSVLRADAPADLEVSVQALAQLALGSAALREALLRPDVRLNANRETLEAVFVRRPVWHPDHY